MNVQISSRKVALGFAIAILSLPFSAQASDTVGAIPVVLGWLAALLLVAGLIGMLILRFAFKLKNIVLLVPFLPGLALAGLTACMFIGAMLEPRAKTFHRGANIEMDDGCVVTVSDQFGEAELSKLYANIESDRFKSEVSQYTHDTVSNFVFGVNLVFPGNREAKHFVVIYTQPQISEEEPAYQGIRYVLSKMVLETDPIPSDTPSPQPPKIN